MPKQNADDIMAVENKEHYFEDKVKQMESMFNPREKKIFESLVNNPKLVGIKKLQSVADEQEKQGLLRMKQT
eukprot:CAMPEP_0116898542 /NCGR_PEP_ID=MMETSP0467-20121206/7253_1 /TAXON_ID=283647 /ORGANISM="Mesodinium pulex, Strain SPMC105" /LENGTH=71 /DNA_ID=CAMNT_0004570751 /DNA_START=179 /DNA_END=394 /DNA_ORIENTATION=-